MENMRKSPKRIIFNLPEEWHTEIKMRATLRNISISDWVKIAIEQRIEEEKKYE